MTTTEGETSGLPEPTGINGLPLPNPQLLAELFDKDPLKLSDQDLDVIIAELRKDRQTFIETSKGDAAKSKSKGATSKAPVVPLGQIDLADLGLL